MKFNCNFVKYFEDENGELICKPADLILLKDCIKTFSAGSLFLIKDHLFNARENVFVDQIYIISSTIASDNLTWLPYSGFKSGIATLLDFETERSESREISSVKLLKALTDFYSVIPEYNAVESKIYFIDGWLETSFED